MIVVCDCEPTPWKVPGLRSGSKGSHSHLATKVFKQLFSKQLFVTVTSMRSCEFESEHYPYYVYVSSTSFVLLLMVLLLAHSLYHQYIHSNGKPFRNDKTRETRLLFVASSVVAIIWLAHDMIRKIIDPHFGVLEDSIWCKLLPYTQVRQITRYIVLWPFECPTHSM